MNEEMQNNQPKRFKRFRTGWLITKSAWKVFTLDKELMVFPLVNFAGAVVVGVVGLITAFALAPNHSIDTNHLPKINWVIGAVCAALITLISTFTSAGVIAAALQRFRGQDPTLRSGMSAVKKRFGSLLLFSLFSTGVAQFLQAIEKRVPFLAGKLLTFLAQMAWSVANIFSVAFIVDSPQKIMPIPAAKKSVGIVKQIWVEGTVGQSAYFSIFLLAAALQLATGIGLAAAASHLIGGTIGGAIAAFVAIIMGVGIILTMLAASAIGGIIQAALYHYAMTGEAPEQINKELLKQTYYVSTKKTRKLFV